MDRYYPLTAVVASATPSTTPTTFFIQLETAELVDVKIQVPAGHVGLTGIRILQSSQQIVPWGNSSWYIADDDREVFEVNEQVNANSITVQAYNTDIYEHAFYMLFHVADLVGAAAASPGQVLASIGGLPAIGGVLPPAVSASQLTANPIFHEPVLTVGGTNPGVGPPTLPPPPPPPAP
jgi:hypothetical protein